MKKRLPLLLLGLFLLIYIAPLGWRPLMVPDETRYAEVPREMIESGNWVSPRLDGLRYFEKPVMGYWLNALSMMAFGQNNFAVRLPSALAAGLEALFIFLLVRRYSSAGESAAMAAGLVFLTTVWVAAVGTVAVLDTLLSLFLTGGVVMFFFALSSTPRSRRESGYLAGAGLFLGFAFMTKGFLAFVVPALTVGAYIVWMARWRHMPRMVLIPLLTAALVSLPWAVLIHLREPDFWSYFFWHEHVQRFLGHGTDHAKPFWYFFAAAPFLMLPWSFLAPAAVAGLREAAGRTGARRELVIFCLLWLMLPMLFFSASSGKLLTYILPCFPPFAILMGIGLTEALEDKPSRGFRAGALGAAVFSLALLAAFLYAQLRGVDGESLYASTWQWMLGAGSMLFMSIGFTLSATCRDKVFSLMTCAVAPALLLFSLQFIIPDRTIEVKSPNVFLSKHVRGIRPDTIVISDDEVVRAVCWAFKRDNVYMIERAGELEYGVEHDASLKRLLSIREAAGLIESNRGDAVLVARGRDYEVWKNFLPAPASVDSSGPRGYVFVKY